MFDWKNIKNIKGFSTKIVDTTAITTKEFVKELRNELNLSQSLFAKILGISEKTVEKWEQGVNPVKGAQSRLLYLLDKNKDLINELYIVDGIQTKNDFNKYKNNINISFQNYNLNFNNCKFSNNFDSKNRFGA